jgi:uroporphyrinogen decarboxylase
MNSRQRVLHSLNHQIPDRVPIDFGGFLSGIHQKAYIKLINYLGITDDLKILDPIQQIAVPCEELLQRFHADIRYISLAEPLKQETPDCFRDEFGIIWKMQDEQRNYMNILQNPLSDATVADIENYSFPNVESEQNRFAHIRQKAIVISQNGLYALSTGIGGSLFELCGNLRGVEKWLLDTKDNPLLCEKLLDKVLKYWTDYYAGLLREIGDIVDIVIIGDDLAGQNGPIFSLDFYRKFLKPRQKELINHIKSLTNAKICYHTCGSCLEFIPELIEIGIDVLNPVQIGLKNMEPQKIKDTFGKQISLWGGATLGWGSTPPFMNRWGKTPPYMSQSEQIKQQVRGNMYIFKPGAGYIFSNTHNIQFDVSPENIIELFDSAYEFGS